MSSIQPGSTRSSSNPVSNTIKYENGKSVHVSARSAWDAAIIQMKDEGIGISPELQVKIFDRFERVTTNKQILEHGLGLYVAKKIVLAHGGEISIKSKLGKDSEVTVRLPKRRSTLPQPLTGSSPVKPGKADKFQ